MTKTLESKPELVLSQGNIPRKCSGNCCWNGNWTLESEWILRIRQSFVILESVCQIGIGKEDASHILILVLHPNKVIDTWGKCTVSSDDWTVVLLKVRRWGKLTYLVSNPMAVISNAIKAITATSKQ